MKSDIVRTALWLLALLALSLCPPSHAATYYVATNGSNGNDGSSEKPFQTIAHGTTQMRGSDTLIVRAGTYTEQIRNTIPGGSSWTAPTIVKAETAKTVTLMAPTGGGDKYGFLFTGTGTKYIEIDGFVFEGDGPGDMLFGVHISLGAHHIRVQNSEIRNTVSNGILVTTGQHEPGDTISCCNEFANLDVHHTARAATLGKAGGGHGIYVSTSNNIIERSHFHHNPGYGIHVYSSFGGVNNNIVRQNRVNNNNLKKNPAGIIIGSGRGNQACNNLVYDNAGGITINGGGSLVYHNTIVNNVFSPGSDSDIGIIAQVSSGVQVRNNIVYGHTTHVAGPGASVASQPNNLIGVDPQFVNLAAKDFRLRDTSPAVNAGAALSEVTVDLVGTRRDKPDIGAYEGAGEGRTTAPPPSTPPPGLSPPRNVRVLGPTP